MVTKQEVKVTGSEAKKLKASLIAILAQLTAFALKERMHVAYIGKRLAKAMAAVGMTATAQIVEYMEHTLSLEGKSVDRALIRRCLRLFAEMKEAERKGRISQWKSSETDWKASLAVEAETDAQVSKIMACVTQDEGNAVLGKVKPTRTETPEDTEADAYKEAKTAINKVDSAEHLESLLALLISRKAKLSKHVAEVK